MGKHLFCAIVLGLALGRFDEAQGAGPSVEIVVGSQAPALERLAADELTATLRKLFDAEARVADAAPPEAANVILVGSPTTNPAVRAAIGDQWPKLSEQGHVLKTVSGPNGRKTLIVGGGSPVATLWAAFEFEHSCGVRSLPHADYSPIEKPAFTLDGFNIELEPLVPRRAWQLVGDSPVGLEAWGLEDNRRLLRQVARLKFNEIVISAHAWQPFVDFEFQGLRKQTAVLFRGSHFPVDGDTAGRKAFHGAAEFENPNFMGKETSAERIEAGVAFVRSLIDAAQDLGMKVTLEMAPLTFPKEFAPHVPVARPSERAEALAVQAAGLQSRADDALQALSCAQVRACLQTYPKLDALDLNVSENVPRFESLHAAWRQLDPKRVRIGRDFSFVEERARVLPQMPLAKAAAWRERAKDSSHKAICFGASSASDLGPAAYYLSRAAFIRETTPESAMASLFTPICGEGVSERLLKGFRHVEAAAKLIEQNDPSFAAATPEFVIKHTASKEPTPTWWSEAREQYTQAMNEMYRGNTRARGGARPAILYFAKRYEFAVHCLTSLEAARKAGVAKAQNNSESQTESLEQAIEALYNALNALADVARDPSDQGTIACLNAYGLRPLTEQLEAVNEEP